MTGVDNGSLDRAWWKEAVVYQIYPRSFNDTDGTGVGDIAGIIEKVDYLADLGVDCVWLNPVYESPNADNGYDIADYQSIMAEFGTMAEWETLLAELHDRDIRLIMDLVVNHTSDEHAWFVESRDPASEKRDWYYWREGVDADAVEWDTDEGPEGEAAPNNWESFFGGPAWAYDEETAEWYLHMFDRKQPDLNWRTDEVREAIFEMMEWWLQKGIDGFRMDVVNLLSKPEGLPAGDPEDPTNGMLDSVANGPHIHEYLSEMNDAVLEDRDLLTVGEMLADEMPMETARRYVGEDGDGLSMIFHFEHMLLDRGETIWEHDDWDLSELKAVFTRWQDGLAEDGWNSLYLNNHDQPRMVSRFGNDAEYRRESAKLLGTLLHTLQGTPYVYQGEELGMTNYPFESLDEFRDVDTLNPLRTAIESGAVEDFESVREAVVANSRDNARTPMQWSDDEQAGFTTGEPWIGVNPNYETVNVASERDDPDSVWHYYRDLIALRDDYDVLVYGEYENYRPDHESLWVYTRTLGEQRLLVTLNFSETPTAFERPTEVSVDESADVDLLLGNYDDVDAAPAATDLDGFTLRPWEARVYHLA